MLTPLFPLLRGHHAVVNSLLKGRGKERRSLSRLGFCQIWATLYDDAGTCMKLDSWQRERANSPYPLPTPDREFPAPN